MNVCETPTHALEHVVRRAAVVEWNRPVESNRAASLVRFVKEPVEIPAGLQLAGRAVAAMKEDGARPRCLTDKPHNNNLGGVAPALSSFLCSPSATTHGMAQISGCVQIVNERHNTGEGSDGAAGQQERLVPRTEDLPIYSVAELNDKVHTRERAAGRFQFW